jgi:predicted nuclease of predicted toxin-antitoxin system
MSLLFDQNISPRILKRLSDHFVGCQQVRFAGLENSSDLEIFQFAKLNDFAVVTFDADFIDLNAMHGTPPKIIYLNTGNLTTNNIAELLKSNILKINHYLKSGSDDILEIIQALS